ncbi:hypothetical protein [uncultured Fibrella sp.]|uniref:hypothetical protein n=1 Tax=uncultured Fibrella sp. TaxID=1284596 RepID=UPI0035CB75E0
MGFGLVFALIAGLSYRDFHRLQDRLIADNCQKLEGVIVSYMQQQLLTNDLPGANASLKQSRQTYLTIREQAANHPLVYLPSHDKGAGQRLATGATLS